MALVERGLMHAGGMLDSPDAGRTSVDCCRHVNASLPAVSLLRRPASSYDTRVLEVSLRNASSVEPAISSRYNTHKSEMATVGHLH